VGTASIVVQPVDDPPLPLVNPIALAAGVERSVIMQANEDQDAPLLAWTLIAAPPGVSAGFEDPAAGRMTLRAALGISGITTVSVSVSDGVNPPVFAAFPLVITAAIDPRPQPAGEFPAQVFRGESLSTAIPFDCQQLATADLDFTLAGEAPAGLQVTRSDATTAIVSWLVPDDEPLVHRRFTLLAIDRAGLSCGALPVVLPVRPRPSGAN
jgi:hypothetical protein